MSCAPVGPLAPFSPPGATCDCGARLHARPSGERDWSWHDGEGRALVDLSPPGYRDDPRGWWARLAQEDIAAYSAMTCRADLGLLQWSHRHRPARGPATADPIPWCCEEPMRAIPAGWECRVSREGFTR